MNKNAAALKIFDAVPGRGSRRKGKLTLRWNDQMEKNLVSFNISNLVPNDERSSNWSTGVHLGYNLLIVPKSKKLKNNAFLQSSKISN